MTQRDPNAVVASVRQSEPLTFPKRANTAPSNIVELLDRIITSTPNTVRAVVGIVVVITIISGMLWLLNADLTAGPVTITGHETGKTTRAER
ncbi:hypothetical protein [Amycolatopsis sp. NPDC051061]|uniref:hypothetical protein n=1 Tax=Amycolatopsis sp. NPDC051061 TaxID=3155042 RepID=UPI003437DDE8